VNRIRISDTNKKKNINTTHVKQHKVKRMHIQCMTTKIFSKDGSYEIIILTDINGSRAE
jgi:hypothetical protein